MTKNSNVTQKEIEAALAATGRTSPVLSAHRQDGDIVLYLCGDKEPVRWKPPGVARADAPKKKASKPKKTFTEG